jgi:hypothetical protein
MMSMLLSIPTGALAGWLFTLNPRAPFIAGAALFAAGAAATLTLMSWHRRGGEVLRRGGVLSP